MKLPVALFVALSLLAAPAARAQPVSARSGPDTYLVLGLGAFLPQAGDIDKLDPNVALSGTFGAMFTPNVGAEASVGYYRASGSLAAAPPLPGVDETLGVVPILAGVRLVAPFKTLEFYGRAGVGVHFASLHATTSAGASTDASATAFGWQAGAGVAFKLSPTMLVGLDLLGTFAEAKFKGVSTRLDGITLAVTLGYRL
jgi:opacity protein-like surface antigen